MSGFNKLPIVVNNAQQGTQQVQGPRTKGQGSHQILFKGPNSIPPPPPPQPTIHQLQQEEEESSLLSATISTTTLLSGSENEEPMKDSEEQVRAQPPPPASTNRRRKKDQPTDGTRNRAPPNTHESVKKTTKTPLLSSTPGMKQVISAIVKDIKVSEHIVKTDNKGTKWLDKIEEDEKPKKLHEISTEPRHNEIEFVNWKRYDKDFVSYLLYTAKGTMFWSNASATRWLEGGIKEGLVPGACTFVVKNNKDTGLVYGFRYKDSNLPAQPVDDVEID